jgi:hypothetical protein
LASFEDFCVVTQSVRQGFEVDVRVDASAAITPPADSRAIA